MSKRIFFVKKKIKYLIIGSNGLLGNEFKKILNKSTYMTLARTKSDYNIDLTKFKKLDFFFKKYQFQNVINCAGVTNLIFCEQNFEKCKKINSTFLKYLTLFINQSSILVGGQAVIEGVLMRVPGAYATAVRDYNNEIISLEQRTGFNSSNTRVFNTDFNYDLRVVDILDDTTAVTKLVKLNYPYVKPRVGNPIFIKSKD